MTGDLGDTQDLFTREEKFSSGSLAQDSEFGHCDGLSPPMGDEQRSKDRNCQDEAQSQQDPSGHRCENEVGSGMHLPERVAVACIKKTRTDQRRCSPSQSKVTSRGMKIGIADHRVLISRHASFSHRSHVGRAAHSDKF
jgi:hypothetical protein